MATVLFKEWLPDTPDLNSPGGLIQCDNVVASVDCYIPHNGAFQLAASTLPAQAQGMFQASGNIYAGTSDRLYVSDTAFTMVARTSTLSPITAYEWDFARFDEFIIATRAGVVPRLHTVNSSSNFTTLAALGTAPSGDFVGVINRFVMISEEDAFGTPYVQWSAIDDPQNWPTPLSATATATQSGQQFLESRYGTVYKIVGGDQFGLIFQRGAITRVTYVGPPVVFQFDLIDTTHGLWWPTAAVKVSGSTHFLGNDGFYVTDGVSLVPTGAGKVDKTFIAATRGTIRATYNDIHKCVTWTTSDLAVTIADFAYCLNVDSGKWTKLDLLSLSNGNNAGIAGRISGIVPYSSDDAFSSFGYSGLGPVFFDSTNVLCYFTDTTAPHLATFRSAWMEPNPGGFSRLSRVRPIVDGATAGAISTVYFAKNALPDGPTTGTDQSVTARDGFTHWRVESRYLMVQTKISGAFTKAIGNEIDIFPTSDT